MKSDAETIRAHETTKRVALLMSVVSSFLGPFMVSGVNVALPTIAREFRMDAVLLTWVPMIYIVSGALTLVPFGKMADIYGRKKVFTGAIALFTISSLFAAFSRSGEMLIVWRLFQGIGAALIYGTSVAILTSLFPPGERGRVLGLTIAAVYLGLSAGPFVGGFITEYLGWRSIFLMAGPLGAALLGAVFWKMKGEWAEAKGERMDVLGALLYSAALAGIMFGFYRLPRPAAALFLLLGIAGFFLFVAWESRVKNPVLDVTLLRTNRVFVLSNVAMFINYSATFAIGFLISLYLQYIKQLPPQAAGLIMISQPIMQAAFSPYAGRLSDRVEPQIVASCGMGLTVIGLVLFTFLDWNTPLWFVVGTLAIHGLAFALFSSPNTNAVMGSVEKRSLGVASAVSSTMRLVGNAFSIGTAMFVFAFYIGQVQITPHYYPAFLTSLRVIFIIFVLLCTTGIVVSMAGRRTRRPG